VAKAELVALLTAPARKRRPVSPGALKRTEAAHYCATAPSTWDRMTAAGITPAPIRLGGLVLWSRAELAAWLKRGCPPRVEWEIIWRTLLAAELAAPAVRTRR